MKQIIGIDIGGTKCAVILAGLDGQIPRIIRKDSIATARYPSPGQMLEKLRQMTEEMLGDGLRDLGGIGISCGGPLDSRKGIILSPPNLPGWDEVHISEYFAGAFRTPVKLQNDANACALAEWKLGSGKGCDNVVFLTFGTGLGAGLILDGRLVTGASGMAGEAGHIRLERFGPVGYGKMGSFEGFCSGGGIANLAKGRLTELAQQGIAHPLQLEEATALRVFELARAGDAACLDICRTVGEHFGRWIAVLIDLLNPDVIIAGSIFTRNYEMLYPIARQVVDRECLAVSARACRILPSALGEEIGDYAALSVALDAGGFR